jgi:uncharacterized protein YuzE
MTDMKIRYFLLYIEFVKNVAFESEEVAPNIVLDYDDTNRVIGIEIEDASKILDFTNLELSALPIVNLIVTKENPIPA